ncbi:hypothetical protein ACRE_016460 [Hapsidospora chrysogenum ATCC 11550]|uniref:Uncharacterized protein n=1 Tax=Hapsidospora chrysogenum (strain ATCC 11550 / CBS 779.69 / DSM 880 / IAM 14645 / JCM 23072 / IMI 49137) TaxID=857340 RepID=A0A086TDK5_HAPC1|nr:hypothetical protein ACRE_016460 [Hapsidospora chrysogenum ATCC 11550]
MLSQLSPPAQAAEFLVSINPTRAQRVPSLHGTLITVCLRWVKERRERTIERLRSTRHQKVGRVPFMGKEASGNQRGGSSSKPGANSAPGQRLGVTLAPDVDPRRWKSDDE